MKDFLRSITPLILRKSIYRVRSGVRRIIRGWLFPPARCKVRTVTVQLAMASELERYRASSYETKEPEMLDWLDEFLLDSDVLFDVGANIGLYSLYAAKLKPGAKIFAFEPESQNFSRLCRNIALNQSPQIVPCAFPLAEDIRFDYFYVSEMVEGGSRHSFGELSNLLEDPSKYALKQGSLSISIDSLIEKHGIPAPTLMKIDVDGIEDKILLGAQRALQSESFRSLIIEFNLPTNANVPPQVAWLKTLGLHLMGRSQWIYQSFDKVRSQNFIFTRVRQKEPASI